MHLKHPDQQPYATIETIATFDTTDINYYATIDTPATSNIRVSAMKRLLLHSTFTSPCSVKSSIDKLRLILNNWNGSHLKFFYETFKEKWLFRRHYFISSVRNSGKVLVFVPIFIIERRILP